MSDKVKDVCIRAGKTFWQAAAAYFTTAFGSSMAGVNVLDFGTVKNVGISLLIGALAAGLSAVWNGVLKPLSDKLSTKK